MMPVPVTWAALDGRFRQPVLGPDGKVWYARYHDGFVTALSDHAGLSFPAAPTDPCILMVPTEREAIEILLATFPNTHKLWET